ncbi:sulfatase-like hydrolase/transferase [Prosthecobacter sp.]|uniref:sulfatase-like hydrolase/transferase n=1 Tax=Prosthecobacter sp. TaxID=1965333 RepID=UPI00378531AE
MKCLLFLCGVVGMQVAGMAAPDEPPNIVLVMADDQGWGDMGYNGHPHLKTPNFDALAKEGIRFDEFHAAAPVCSPTRGSVMTGRTPNRYGCFAWGHPLRPQEITVAEALKTAGYATGHFGKWHLGSVQKASPVSPGNSGFDEWVSAPNYFDLNPVMSVQGKAVPFQGDSSDITVDEALKFIRKCGEKKQRFLAVVWFGSPHDPHRALEEDRAGYAGLPEKEQNFYGEITAMDRAFGRLRAELKELDLRENTLLWYCSDNGALPKVGETGGRRGNKGQIYEGGLAVPGLMEWPAAFHEPKVIKAPCVTSDIYPTVLALADVKMEKQPPLDGIDLMPLLMGQEQKRSRPIGFWDMGRPGIGVNSKEWMNELLAAQAKGEEPADPVRVRPEAGKIEKKVSLTEFPGHAAWLDWPWKLHRIENKKTHDVKWELYNLASDPDESTVLLAEQPERVPEMQKSLEDWLESVARSLNGEDYAGEKAAAK